ncbi:MAG: hypothetical protein WCD57_04150, partial [Acidobacteriaceae bacterium]
WIAVIAVLYAFLPIYGQEKGSQPAANQENPKSLQRPEENSSSPVTVNVINQQAPANQTQGAKRKPKGYFCTLISANNLPSLGLVAVGIGGIVVAVLTLKTIQRQTAATEKAAEASLEQANHLVASERAYVLIETGEITDEFSSDESAVGAMDLRPVIRNFGKTPARIVGFSINRSDISRRDQLPPEPTYRESPIVEISLPPELAIQPMNIQISLRDFAEPRRGNTTLYIYGFVDYLDFAEQKRRSRFCFIYYIPRGPSAMKRGFHMAAEVPSAYTKNT